MDIGTYVDYFEDLRQEKRSGLRHPSKPILLLAIIHLYEIEYYRDNEIVLDNTLRHTFNQLWDRLAKDTRDLFDANIVEALWQMQTELFWHIEPNEGYSATLRSLKTTQSSITSVLYEEYVHHAELDSDLGFLLTLDFARERFKEVLISTYFGISLDSYRAIERDLSEYVENADEDSELQSKIEVAENKFSILPENLQIDIEILYWMNLRKHEKERKTFRHRFPNVQSFYLNVIDTGIHQLEEIDQEIHGMYRELVREVKIMMDKTDYCYDITQDFLHAYFTLFPRNEEGKRDDDGLGNSSALNDLYASGSLTSHPEKKAEKNNEKFAPTGKIRFICDNLESSYDYLWMLAITDLLREEDADNIMTYDNLAAMMIANAWEMAYNIPTVKDHESEIMECIDFLMNKSKREVGVSLSLSSTKQEVYDALKDFPMYGVYEDLVDKMVEDTPFNILKTWFGNEKQVRIVERSQSYEESSLYGIFPRKYDPHIQINTGWKKYFCRKNAELMHYFCEKYLQFIGGTEDDILLLDYFLPQVEEEQPEDSKADIDDTLARYAHLLTPQVSETKESNVSTTPQPSSAFAFTPIPRATMRARKKADEAETRKKAEAAECMDRWGTTEEFTVITDELIDAALTPRGGITRSQLEAVGLSWPKPLDWREQILGMKLSPEELRQFMTIKYAKP